MTWQKGTSLRSICSRALRHTSAHGVPNIIHSQDQWRSCCWTTFVLLVLGCMLWQCSQLTATYLQYPTQEKVTLVNRARLPFPAVTFCNLNRARMSQLTLSKYHSLQDYLTDPSPDNYEEGVHGHEHQRNFAFALSQLSTQDQMELGHQLKDMLISCVFHNEVVMKGLTMELHIEQNEYMTNVSTAAGLRVVLHGQGKMPFPEDEGVNIPPGQESDIGVVKVHVKRLQEPYNSRCSSGHDIRNYYADVYGTEYSREACKKSCAQIKMIKNCGCRMWEFPAPPGIDIPICNISEPPVNDCVEMYEYKLSHDQLKCHCPLQCQEENFQLTLSSSQWPSSKYLDYFSQHIQIRHGYEDVENLRDNIVKLVVYYQQLNYELIEEVPSMQLVDLFSSIGGLVGLWIGVSVCTVAEFLELILNLVTFVIGRIPKKEDAPENPYSITKSQPEECSPNSVDRYLLWSPLNDVSSLLRNNSEDTQSLHNPYQSYETLNEYIFNV